MRTLWFPMALHLVAVWPVWQWYGSRFAHIAGETYVLVAFTTALALVGWQRHATNLSVVHLVPGIACLAAYGLLYVYLPMEIKAGLALISLAFPYCLLATGTWPHPGMFGLCLLGLPIIPSLQFYLGYPMRLVVAYAAAAMLRVEGLPVLPRGSCLVWAGNLVGIDAPCSGVRMLWAAGYLACTLSLLCRLSTMRTVIVGATVVPLVLLANTLRSVSLFHVETGLLPCFRFAHEMIGVFYFCLLALAIAMVVLRLRKGLDSLSGVVCTGINPTRVSTATVYVVSSIVCIAVGLMPLVHTPASVGQSDIQFPGWPKEWNGRPLVPLALATDEQEAARSFPGHVARFTDGRYEYLIRWITEPTRKMHPVADCFRARGAHITVLPLHMDARGRLWETLNVEISGRHFTAFEQFSDSTGTTWSDVSNWYWAALFGKTAGPWWVFEILASTNVVNSGNTGIPSQPNDQ